VIGVELDLQPGLAQDFRDVFAKGVVHKAR
jgi:hypothetical protein